MFRASASPRPSSRVGQKVSAVMATGLRRTLRPLRPLQCILGPPAGKWRRREGVLGATHTFDLCLFLAPQMCPFEPGAMAPPSSTPNTSPLPRCRRCCWPRALPQWPSTTRIATVRPPALRAAMEAAKGPGAPLVWKLGQVPTSVRAFVSYG